MSAAAVIRLAGGDVLLEEFGYSKIITLTREKALNALTWQMVQGLLPYYKTWACDHGKHAVIIKGAGPKAFCAGGDVVSLVKGEEKGAQDFFFKEEYTLNHMIGSLHRLDIPHIALLDGIVMGGGVGLSVHGSIRVCNETTLFAMPECAIGLFPDVGGSIFLPRLPFGGMGSYLALTGRRLKGADVVRSGIGTHYVPRDKFPALTEALQRAHSKEDIRNVVESAAVPVIQQEFSIAPDSLKLIEEIFTSPSSIEEIIVALKRTQAQKEFAEGLIKDMMKGSPTSLRLTLEQLRRGAHQTPEENFKMEYRLAQACLNQTQDFNEGVRAALIDKTGSPRWSPATLEEVSTEYIESFFNTIPKTGDLELHPPRVASSLQE